MVQVGEERRPAPVVPGALPRPGLLQGRLLLRQDLTQGGQGRLQPLPSRLLVLGNVPLGVVHDHVGVQPVLLLQEVVVPPLLGDPAVLEEHQPVALLEVLHPVGDQQHRLVPQHHLHVLVEDVLADLGVHRGEGVVQQVDVHVGVQGPRQVHPLLLAARQGDAPLPDLGHVALGHGLEVGCEGTGLDDLLVPGLLHGAAHQDVVPQGGVEDPGLLGHEGQGAVHLEAAALQLHLAHDGGDERGLAGAHGPGDSEKLTAPHAKVQVEEAVHKDPLQGQDAILLPLVLPLLLGLGGLLALPCLLDLPGQAGPGDLDALLGGLAAPVGRVDVVLQL